MKHRKRKNKTNINKVLKHVSCVNVSRYTLDAWLKTYPESNEEEWEIVTSPGDVYTFVEHSQRTFEVMGIESPSLRIVTLDDEFFQYLKENNLENNEDNRVQYVNTVSDEKALDLYSKQEYNSIIDTYGLCIILLYKNPPLKLSFCMDKTDRDELKSYLELIFGKNNVAVSKYIFRPDEFLNEFERISTMGEMYITKNRDISYFAYENIKNAEGVNLIRRYIPLTIRSERTTPYFKITDDENIPLLTREFPEIVNMQGEALLENGYDNVPGLDTLKCFEHIQQKLGAFTMDVEPFLTCCEDVPEVEEAFVKIFKKEARGLKKKITFK